MSWRWTARRLAISAYLVVHLSALLIWVLPACPIKERGSAWARYYIVPSGLWQSWTMFAPDPLGDTLMLEAEVVDARGLRYVYPFTKVGELSWWRAIPRFRHSKFAANLLIDEFAAMRAVTARHAVRNLGLPDDAFPLDVSLIHQIRRPSPPGQPTTDPMTPTQPRILETFHFAAAIEVRP